MRDEGWYEVFDTLRKSPDAWLGPLSFGMFCVNCRCDLWQTGKHGQTLSNRRFTRNPGPLETRKTRTELYNGVLRYYDTDHHLMCALACLRANLSSRINILHV